VPARGLDLIHVLLELDELHLAVEAPARRPREKQRDRPLLEQRRERDLAAVLRGERERRRAAADGQADLDGAGSGRSQGGGAGRGGRHRRGGRAESGRD
jgi:hypothetical protein